MREDTLSGSEYRDVLKIVGLSYDDQIWAYGLSLYRFSQTRDDSNLTRDERVHEEVDSHWAFRQQRVPEQLADEESNDA